MYFQNRYLYNAAIAGYNGGLNVNFDYMQQWSEFPGTPKTTSLSADFAATDRVGLGINFSDDQAGLLRTTNVVGSYAYHLPLSSTGTLHFGLSLGANDSMVNTAAINGTLQMRRSPCITCRNLMWTATSVWPIPTTIGTWALPYPI